MVMETWDKAKVVGYREKEYNVGMVQDDEQPGDDDEYPTVPVPSSGRNLLLVTGKRWGRPRKGIVLDGLVQLQIQNCFSKNVSFVIFGSCHREAPALYQWTVAFLMNIQIYKESSHICHSHENVNSLLSG